MESIVKSVNSDNGLSSLERTAGEPNAASYAVGHAVEGAGFPARRSAR